jgi:hypothetical protein
MLSEGKQDKEREREKGKVAATFFEGGLHARTPRKKKRGKEEEEEGFDK